MHLMEETFPPFETAATQVVHLMMLDGLDPAHNSQDLMLQYLAVIRLKQARVEVRGVTGRDDPRLLPLQQALRQQPSVLISESLGEDPVNKAFENRRHAGPPNRIDEDQQVGLGDDRPVFRRFRVVLQIPAAMFLVEIQDWIEPFLIEVEEGDGVFGLFCFFFPAGLSEATEHGPQDCLIVTTVIRISIENCDIHNIIYHLD